MDSINIFDHKSQDEINGLSLDEALEFIYVFQEKHFPGVQQNTVFRNLYRANMYENTEKALYEYCQFHNISI